jgi:hypothetical protein
MVTAPSTENDSLDNFIGLASYKGYTKRPDFSSAVEVSLRICWCHCETIEEIRCKHDNPMCRHKPLYGEPRYLGKARWGMRPIYYNTEPRPYLWYEQEQWLE